MTTLVIGSSAVGSDGYRGEVQAVVVDPAARTVTHLVVEPHGRRGWPGSSRSTSPTSPMHGRIRSGCAAPRWNS
jgi:sporulation protein YlmC with PRC-barrel domain